MRIGSDFEKHRIGFLEERIDIYKLMVELWILLNKKCEAFEYVKRLESMALMDLVSNVEIVPVNGLSENHDEEENYLLRLRHIQNRRLRREKVQEQLCEVEAILQNLKSIYEKIEKRDPEYVSLRRVMPISDKITCEVLML